MLPHDIGLYKRSVRNLPIKYTSYPDAVKIAHPELANYALRSLVWQDEIIAYKIYESVPDIIKINDLCPEGYHTPLSQEAVAKSPACYLLIPEKSKANNWTLILLACKDLGKHSELSLPPNFLVDFIHAMPPLMAACFVEFWLRHPVNVFNLDQTRFTYVTERIRSHFGENHQIPHVSYELALEWVRLHNEMGYLMLPLAAKLAYPDLLHILITRTKIRPNYVPMIPTELLLQDTEVCTQLVTSDIATYQFLPLEVRSQRDDLARYVLEHHSNVSPIMYIPDTVFLRNPEWVTAFCAHDPVNYTYLPPSVQAMHPDHAASLVRFNDHNYRHHVPDTVKQGNWDLATMAVSASPSNYAHVPDGMRGADNEQSLELARLALRRDATYPRPHSLTERRHRLVHFPPQTDPTATQWDLQSKFMSGVTRNALLRRLHDTDNGQLRHMGLTQHARAAVISHNELATHFLTTRKPGSLGVLPTNIMEDILEMTKPLSAEREHEHWAEFELRKLWKLLNTYMQLLRFHHYMGRPATMDELVAQCQKVLLFFCDPRYAYSIDENSPAGELPLLPSQLRLARSVAQQLWELQGVIQATFAVYPELDGHHDVDFHPYFLEILPPTLTDLGFAPEGLVLPAFATRYLDTTDTVTLAGPMFCEFCGDQFPIDLLP